MPEPVKWLWGYTPHKETLREYLCDPPAKPKKKQKPRPKKGRAPLTEELKKKLSEIAKARVAQQKAEGTYIPPTISPETRAKMVAGLQGRKLTEEHKAKIGEKSKGRKLSPESIEKRRESLRRAWVKRREKMQRMEEK